MGHIYIYILLDTIFLEKIDLKKYMYGCLYYNHCIQKWITINKQ